jgi:hypothetical protein
VPTGCRLGGKRSGRSLAAYFPAKQATLALLMARPQDQRLKQDRPLFHQYMPGPDGSNLAIRGVGYQALAAGEMVEYHYAIYWDDGNRLDEAHQRALALQADAGSSLFRAP